MQVNHIMAILSKKKNHRNSKYNYKKKMKFMFIHFSLYNSCIINSSKFATTPDSRISLIPPDLELYFEQGMGDSGKILQWHNL